MLHDVSNRWGIRCTMSHLQLQHLAVLPPGESAPVAPATPSHTRRVTVTWWCPRSSWDLWGLGRPSSSIQTRLWLRASLSTIGPSRRSPKALRSCRSEGRATTAAVMDGGRFLRTRVEGHQQARRQVLVYMNILFYDAAVLLSFSAVSHSQHHWSIFTTKKKEIKSLLQCDGFVISGLKTAVRPSKLCFYSF